MLRGDVDGTALVRVIAGPLAGDHDVHAVVAENALQLDDVSQPRDIVEDQGVLGQQTRDHQGQRRVLGARNWNCAVQTLSANYAYPVHARPVPSSRSGYDGRDIETRAPLPQCQYWKLAPSTPNCGESPAQSLESALVAVAQIRLRLLPCARRPGPGAFLRLALSQI